MEMSPLRIAPGLRILPSSTCRAICLCPRVGFPRVREFQQVHVSLGPLSCLAQQPSLVERGLGVWNRPDHSGKASLSSVERILFFMETVALRGVKLLPHSNPSVQR